MKTRYEDLAKESSPRLKSEEKSTKDSFESAKDGAEKRRQIEESIVPEEGNS